jgi:hypothetical protein
LKTANRRALTPLTIVGDIVSRLVQENVKRHSDDQAINNWAQICRELSPIDGIWSARLSGPQAPKTSLSREDRNMSSMM